MFSTASPGALTPVTCALWEPDPYKGQALIVNLVTPCHPVSGLLWTREWPAWGHFGGPWQCSSCSPKCTCCWVVALRWSALSFLVYCPVSWCVFHIVDAVLEDPWSLLAMAYMNVPSWRSCVSAELLLPAATTSPGKTNKQKKTKNKGEELFCDGNYFTISMKKPFCWYFLLVLTEHFIDTLLIYKPLTHSRAI